MAKRKEKLAAPDEIIFGDVTRADLDQLIYGMLSVRMHNNMVIPECYRNGTTAGYIVMVLPNTNGGSLGI